MLFSKFKKYNRHNVSKVSLASRLLYAGPINISVCLRNSGFLTKRTLLVLGEACTHEMFMDVFKQGPVSKRP